VSVSQICDDSVNAIEAAYGEQARPATTGPVVQSASYTLTGQQVEIVAARKKEATADCASKLHKAAQAGWSYISARGGWRSRWTRRSRSSPPR
jgi:hypothetical protein